MLSPIKDIIWHKHSNSIDKSEDDHVYEEDGMCWCHPTMETVETEAELVRDHKHLWGLVEIPCNLFIHN